MRRRSVGFNNLAAAYCSRGDQAEAVRLASEGLALVVDRDDRIMECEALIVPVRGEPVVGSADRCRG